MLANNKRVLEEIGVTHILRVIDKEAQAKDPFPQDFAYKWFLFCLFVCYYYYYY